MTPTAFDWIIVVVLTGMTTVFSMALLWLDALPGSGAALAVLWTRVGRSFAVCNPTKA